MSEYITSNSHFFTWLKSTYKDNVRAASREIQHLPELAMAQEFRKRQKLRKLLAATPEHLSDIGLSRADIKASLALSLDQSASRWLESKRRIASNKALDKS